MIHEIYLTTLSEAFIHLDKLKEEYYQDALLHSSERLIKENELLHSQRAFSLLEQEDDEQLLRAIFKVNTDVDLVVFYYQNEEGRQETFHFVIQKKVIATGCLNIHYCQLSEEYLFLVSLIEYDSPFSGYEFVESLKEIEPDMSEVEVREYGIDILRRYLLYQYLVIL